MVREQLPPGQGRGPGPSSRLFWKSRPPGPLPCPLANALSAFTIYRQTESLRQTVWLAKLKIWTVRPFLKKEFAGPLNESARAAMTKDHGPHSQGGLHPRNVFSPSSGGAGSLRSRCGEDWFLLKPRSMTCGRCLHPEAFPGHPLRGRLCPNRLLLDTCPTGSGLTLMTAF